MSTIRLIGADEAEARIDELADVLVDCVEGGASVGFLSPYGPADAGAYWRGVAAAVAGEATLLFVAEDEGRIVGTVQLGIGLPPNQPHRADLKKLLVLGAARGRGHARALMAAAEAAALSRGRTVLVLDTATGSPAEAIYARLGWSRVGVIPDYALYPDGSFCATTLFFKRLGESGM